MSKKSETDLLFNMFVSCVSILGALCVVWLGIMGICILCGWMR